MGTEFSSTGSDGKVAMWTDRSVVTEAERPRTFEFVTEGARHGKPSSSPWHATAIHRYELRPDGPLTRVVYTQQLTRLTGVPAILRNRLMTRLMFRVSAKFMRRGFDALLATAQERAPRS